MEFRIEVETGATTDEVTGTAEVVTGAAVDEVP